jgi:hypothetical protein
MFEVFVRETRAILANHGSSNKGIPLFKSNTQPCIELIIFSSTNGWPGMYSFLYKSTENSQKKFLGQVTF